MLGRLLPAYWHEIEPEREVSAQLVGEYLASLGQDLLQGRRLAWWGLEGRTVYGFVIFRVQVGLGGRPLGYVEHLYVRPSRRRTGLGRALAQAAIDHLVGVGATEVQIHVRHENPAAVQFWQSLGFATTAYLMAAPSPTPQGEKGKRGKGKGGKRDKGEENEE